MVRRGSILLLLLLSVATRAWSQNYWEVSLGGEYMLTAYDFRSVHNTWGTGLQATFFHRVTGDDYWIRKRHNPSFGVKLDFGLTPQSICGNRIGMAAMVRTPLLPWLDADIGLGQATYTKPNYRTGDESNVYISTPVVCLFDMGLVFHIDRQSDIALRMIHSSNGAIRQPNRGLNFFRLEMGMALDGGSHHRRWEDWSALQPDKAPWHEIGLMVAPSLVQSRYPRQHGAFFCYDLSINYEYHYTPILGVGGTVDFWYNCSHTEQFVIFEDDYSLPFYMNAMFFLEGFWGKMSIKGGVGAVLMASSRVKIPVCERLAIYYNFGNNYAGVGINALAGQAQFIEWSFGHRFKIKG